MFKKSIFEPILHISTLRLVGLYFAITLVLTACTLIMPKADPSPVRLPNIPRDSRLIGERQFGVFVPEAAWKASETVVNLEKSINHEFEIIHWFTDWSHDFEVQPIQKAYDLGRAPLITWQATEQSLEDILAGKNDPFIKRWARASAQQGEFYVRIFPEMNGDWTAWHGDPELLKNTWIHMVSLFRNEGATNVQWVWTPNVTDEPNEAWNKFENYYPGDAYVDIVGLDGYNWGTSKAQTRWTYFEPLFADAYIRLADLTSKPMWIAEVASAEKGGSKALWIEDMLSSNAFPRVEAVIWFNEKKEADWRIESSGASKNAFGTWFANSNANR